MYFKAGFYGPSCNSFRTERGLGSRCSHRCVSCLWLLSQENKRFSLMTMFSSHNAIYKSFKEQHLPRSLINCKIRVVMILFHPKCLWSEFDKSEIVQFHWIELWTLCCAIGAIFNSFYTHFQIFSNQYFMSEKVFRTSVKGVSACHVSVQDWPHSVYQERLKFLLLGYLLIYLGHSRQNYPPA